MYEGILRRMRDLVLDQQYVMTYHARQEMNEDGLSVFDVEQGIITGAGRGSGYASVLLRCLGVTYGVDPIKYGLIWERFLGFDEKKFVREQDFGFQEEIDLSKIVEKVSDSEEDEIEEEEKKPKKGKKGGLSGWSQS